MLGFCVRRLGDPELAAVLDPAKGEGGPLGWCTGMFRGTVRYDVAYACPATGRCHVPQDFRESSRIVARFEYRAR